MYRSMTVGRATGGVSWGVRGFEVAGGPPVGGGGGVGTMGRRG